jgi:hypothetical protein
MLVVACEGGGGRRWLQNGDSGNVVSVELILHVDGWRFLPCFVFKVLAK